MVSSWNFRNNVTYVQKMCLTIKKKKKKKIGTQPIFPYATQYSLLAIEERTTYQHIELLYKLLSHHSKALMSTFKNSQTMMLPKPQKSIVHVAYVWEVVNQLTTFLVMI